MLYLCISVGKGLGDEGKKPIKHESQAAESQSESAVNEKPVSGREDSNCPNPQAWDEFHFYEQGQVALASTSLELELGS